MSTQLPPEPAFSEDPRIITTFASPFPCNEEHLLMLLPVPRMNQNHERAIVAYWDDLGRIVVRRREGQMHYTHGEVYDAVRELLFRTLGPCILGEFPVARAQRHTPGNIVTTARKLICDVFSFSASAERQQQPAATAQQEVERLRAWLRDHAESVVKQLRDIRECTMESHKHANMPRLCSRILLERDEQPGTRITCFLNGRKTHVKIVSKKRISLNIDATDGLKRVYSDEWDLSAVTETYCKGIHFSVGERFFILRADENGTMAVLPHEEREDPRVEWDGERYLTSYDMHPRNDAGDLDEDDEEGWRGARENDRTAGEGWKGDEYDDDSAGEEWKNI